MSVLSSLRSVISGRGGEVAAAARYTSDDIPSELLEKICACSQLQHISAGHTICFSESSTGALEVRVFQGTDIRESFAPNAELERLIRKIPSIGVVAHKRAVREEKEASAHVISDVMRRYQELITKLEGQVAENTVLRDRVAKLEGQLAARTEAHKTLQTGLLGIVNARAASLLVSSEISERLKHAQEEKAARSAIIQLKIQAEIRKRRLILAELEEKRDRLQIKKEEVDASRKLLQEMFLAKVYRTSLKTWFLAEAKVLGDGRS